MSTVKGSRQDKLMVVAYRPGQRLFLRLLAVVVVAVVVTSSYYLGEYLGLEKQRSAVVERDSLQQQLILVEKNNKDYQQQIIAFEQGSKVDREAGEVVRTAVKELKDEVARLNEEVTFYKGVMAPTTGDKGLRIQKWNITKTTDAKRFRYKLVLTQVADNKTYIKGLVAINLVGHQGKEKKVIPVKELVDLKASELKFRFRYFQDIAGEVTLPLGFTPEQVQVVAHSTGRKAMRAEKSFNWLKQESDANVGQEG